VSILFIYIFTFIHFIFKSLLKERIDAIDELINGQIIHTSNFEKLKRLLHTIPDIEKALCHIFYKRVCIIYLFVY